MKDIDFLIFYEVKNREFESVVLIRNELVKRGYNVKYVGFSEGLESEKLREFVDRVKVAIMPSLYHETECLEIVYRIAGRVDKLINLRWEQVYSNETEIDKEYYAYSKGIAKEAYQCCWGERPKLLVESAGVKPEKICVTGPVQMDLLLPQFRKRYLSRKELFKKYDINPQEPVVLYISSFSNSTMTDEELANYVTQFEKKERESYLEFASKEKQTIKLITEWLSRLSKERNCTIIYRPHPTENGSEEVEELKTLPNIKVISDENVKQWILCCDQVYTWYSTSLAEAYVANVPCFILRPVELSFGDDIPIYRSFSYITHYEDLLANYDKLLQTQGVCDNYYKDCKLNEYYDIKKDYPSYKRTADYFEWVLKEGDNFPWEAVDDAKLSKQRRFRIVYPIKRKIIDTVATSPLGKMRLFKKFRESYENFYNDPFLKNTITSKEFADMENFLGKLVEEVEA